MVDVGLSYLPFLVITPSPPDPDLTALQAWRKVSAPVQRACLINISVISVMDFLFIVVGQN